MRPLPTHHHVPSTSAAWWLLALAPLLWTADLCLLHWSRDKDRLVEAYRFQKDGREWMVSDIRPWVGPLRAAIPVTILLLLALTRRIELRDAGLTLGRPKVTLLWVGVPVLFTIVFGGGLLVLGIAAIHLFSLNLPQIPLEPIFVIHRNALSHTILHAVILAPLIEEPLYRGIPVAFLERFGGRRLALLGGGVIWAALHFIYGWGAYTIPFYFLFWGVLVTWIYLQTHSVVTTILLHALCNLFAPVLLDLLLLEHRDLVMKWIWRAP
jgi:membrane protease YdiL (CAAX protease family)